MPISPPTLPSALGRAAIVQSQEIARRLDGVLNGRVRDVHRMRVASRRLREVLAVMGAAGVPGARRLRRRVRRLTRALGGVRELDVMLDELAKARERHAWAAAEVLRWRRDLETQRAKRRERLARVLERIAPPAWEAECGRLAAGARRAPPGPWQDALSARVSKRATAAVTAILGCGAAYDPTRLHQLRIAAKKLRYALELDPAASNTLGLRHSLRQTQQQLGHWHDLHVLALALADRDDRKARRASSRAGRPMSAEPIEAECRAQHAALLPELPSLAVDVIRLRHVEAAQDRAPTRMARTRLKESAHARRA